MNDLAEMDKNVCHLAGSISALVTSKTSISKIVKFTVKIFESYRVKVMQPWKRSMSNIWDADD